MCHALRSEATGNPAATVERLYLRAVPATWRNVDAARVLARNTGTSPQSE